MRYRLHAGNSFRGYLTIVFTSVIIIRFFGFVNLNYSIFLILFTLHRNEVICLDTLDKILLLIKQRGLKQKNLADELGLKDTVVSDWKKGKSKSYLKYIYQIADFLGTTPEYLLGKTDNGIIPNPSLSSSQLELLNKFDQLSTDQQKDVLQYVEFIISKREKDGD